MKCLTTTTKNPYLHSFVHSRDSFLGGADTPQIFSPPALFPFTLNFHLCSFLSVGWASFITLPQVNRSSSCPRLFRFLMIWSLTLDAAAPCHPFILNLPRQYEQRERGTGELSQGAYQEFSSRRLRLSTKGRIKVSQTRNNYNLGR